MSAARNVLFIMCDQLRADHLGCYGHPFLETPNLEALSRRGVRFDRAFVQSGVCGPPRMSFYTGRYVASHGATWNRVPLSIGEYADLGRDPGHEHVHREMHERLLAWFMRLKRRVTVTDADVEAGTAAHKRAGVFFGQW